jgi:AcrR family transcriptional regulator
MAQDHMLLKQKSKAKRATAPVPPPRKASREHRRSQLIEATIVCIAALGYSRTTLTAVAKAANLSHGLVNFHFETKEKLLAETLLHLAAEYRENWTAALTAASGGPAAELDALLRADFDPVICKPAKLSAWCAFWGEAQSRPIYQESCESKDLERIRTIESVCRRLVSEGGYSCDPVLAARVLRVTLEGVWLDMMTMTKPYSRAQALRTVYACARAFFPEHYDAAGLKRSASPRDKYRR